MIDLFVQELVRPTSFHPRGFQNWKLLTNGKSCHGRKINEVLKNGGKSFLFFFTPRDACFGIANQPIQPTKTNLYSFFGRKSKDKVPTYGIFLKNKTGDK